MPSATDTPVKPLPPVRLPELGEDSLITKLATGSDPEGHKRAAKMKKARAAKPVQFGQPASGRGIPKRPPVWVPTHILDGREVMRVTRLIEGPHGPPVYFDQAGNMAQGNSRARPEPIIEYDDDGRPMDQLERAYWLGRRDAEKAAEGQILAPRQKLGATMRQYRTRDVAAAIMAVLAAHGGAALVFTAEGTEGEFVRQEADGSYIVSARVYDWIVKTHDVQWVRIPPFIDLEVVEAGA